MMAAAAAGSSEQVRDYITFYQDEVQLKFPANADHPRFQVLISLEQEPRRTGRSRGFGTPHPDPTVEKMILRSKMQELNDRLHEGLMHIKYDRCGVKQPLIPQQSREYPPADFGLRRGVQQCFQVPDPFGPEAVDKASPLNQAVQLQRKMTRLTRQTQMTLTSLLMRFYNIPWGKAKGMAAKIMNDLTELVEQYALAISPSSNNTT